MLVCIQRIIKVIESWKESGKLDLEYESLDQQAILLLVSLNETKPNNIREYVIEIGELVKVSVRLSDKLTGTSESVSLARRYLLNLNDGSSVKFKEDEKNGKQDVLGIIGIEANFECNALLYDLELALLKAIFSLDDAILVHYEDIIKRFCELHLEKLDV